MTWLFYVGVAIVAAVARDIAQKRALQHEHTSEYLAIRSAIIVLAILPFFQNAKLDFTWQGWTAIGLTSVLLTAALICRNRALKREDVSIVQPLQNLQPFFVVILGYVLLQETLTEQQILGILAIIVGTYWLETDPEHHSLSHVWTQLTSSMTALYVITASAILGLTNIIARYVLTEHTNAYTYLLLTFALTGVLYTAYSILSYGTDFAPVIKKHGWTIALPSLFTAAQIFSLYHALSLMTAGIVIALYRTQSIFTTIEGGLHFNEEALLRRTTAALLTAAGAALVIL